MDLTSLLKYDGMTLEIVIWSLFIGIVIGVFGSFYVKQVLGAFVRKLLEVGADSPQNAKTMSELGFDKNYFVLNALKETSTLRKLISCDGDADVPENITAKKQRELNLGRRWYIPRELFDRAELMYDSRGNTIGVALISILAFMIAALISFMVIPDLVQMASNAFSSFGA